MDPLESYREIHHAIRPAGIDFAAKSSDQILSHRQANPKTILLLLIIMVGFVFPVETFKEAISIDPSPILI